ncbi:MAG: hypothetical protein IH571_06385 [Acholeplasmataceae bacterium]|nr:hypothetical protein [Acholeplasmataceae bacterium]
MKHLKTILIICITAILSFGLGSYMTKTNLTNQINQDFWALEQQPAIETVLLSIEDVASLEGEPNYEMLFNLQADLINLSLQIQTAREQVLVDKQTLQGTANQFKVLEVRLSLTDRLASRGDLLELKAHRENFISTHGQAYQKLLDLRENFDVENIDFIILTYTDVISVLEYRLGLLQEAHTLMVELNTRLLHYIES